jgi:hypothetical protein
MKTKGASPQELYRIHHPKKHMNKLNNTKKVGLGHALVHLKKMMSLMRSTMCQVQFSRASSFPLPSFWNLHTQTTTNKSKVTNKTMMKNT